MKVAMIGLRGLDDGLGGVETALRHLGPKLVREGIDLTCYCRGRYNTQNEFQGVKLVNSPTYYSKHLETVSYAIWSYLEAIREGYDIIHVHALASASLSWLPKLLKSPSKIIVTIHGLDWQRAKWGFLAKGALKFGEKSIAKFSDCAICVSISLNIYFQMCYPGHSFFYIPNGTEELQEKELPPPLGLKSKKYFLYIGRIVPEKGIHRLIEAYRMVKTDFPLIIAGPVGYSDRYGKYLSELASKDSRVRLIGPVVGQEKESLLSNAYLFVLPSEIEGLPVALLEAVSRGVCPAISSIPTSIEVVGTADLQRGFVFDPTQITEIKEVLEISLECPELVKALGERAAEYARANYNWDTIAKKTKKVYHKICSPQ